MVSSKNVTPRIQCLSFSNHYNIPNRVPNRDHPTPNLKRERVCTENIRYEKKNNCIKVLCYPNLLSEEHRRHVLCKEGGVSQSVDGHLIDALSHDLDQTNNLIEMNTGYQVMRVGKSDCSIYEYDMTTANLHKNWVLYVSLDTHLTCHFDFSVNGDADVILKPGAGVLISETDENFHHDNMTTHSICLEKRGGDVVKVDGNMLMKRLF